MNAVLNKPLHSLGTFACETAGAPMNNRVAVRVAKLVLAGVLAVPPVAVGVLAFGLASPVAALVALALAVFPVAVVQDALHPPLDAGTDDLDDLAADQARRDDEHWRYYSPLNPAAPINQVRGPD